MTNYKLKLDGIKYNCGLVDLKEAETFNLSKQYFSGTDTNKSKGNLGIIYPFDNEETIKDYITASSIIDHHNGDRYLLKHTEVRVCNSNDDNTLTYQKIENTIPIVIHDNTISEISNAVQSILFKSREDISIKVPKDSKSIRLEVELIEQYSKFSPLVIVSEKNIEKKKIEYEATYFGSYSDGYISEDFPLSLEELETALEAFKKLDKKVREKFYSWYEFAIYDYYGELDQSVEAFRKMHKINQKKIEKDTKKAIELISSQSLF